LLKAVPDFDYIRQNRQLTGVVLGGKAISYRLALPDYRVD
jgi:hypothetical protein